MTEKDGGDGRRGSGHHSLSQLTQPSGVALSLSRSLPPSMPPPLKPHSFPPPSSVETEGEGSVGELTVAVHFTVGLRILKEMEAGGGGGGGGGGEWVASEKFISNTEKCILSVWWKEQKCRMRSELMTVVAEVDCGLDPVCVSSDCVDFGSFSVAQN